MGQENPDEQAARKYADDALTCMSRAVGNVEMVMVIRDGSWDEPRRRAAVLALLAVVLEERRHPSNRPSPPAEPPPATDERGGELRVRSRLTRPWAQPAAWAHRQVERSPSDASIAALPRVAACAAIVASLAGALVWWLL